MVTIKDIARRANVSVATVSYVLNDTRPVHPDKRERVLRAIEELNYVPNASARGLRAKKTKTIGLVISDITNPFYPDLAKGCQDVAQENNYTLMMFNANDEEDRLKEIVRQSREGKVDGLIITSVIQSDEKALRDLIKNPYPVVFAHRNIEKFNVDCVMADNFTGAYKAAKHLIELGNKKIVFMEGLKGSSVNQDRVKGYVAAMKEANLSEWLVSAQDEYQSSYNAAVKLLKLPAEKRPTAIFTSTDLKALGVLDAAKDMGISVPEDLAVIGFDDLFFASSRALQLSSVRVPRQEIGRIATKILLDKIKKESASEPQKIVLECELIVRKTCGASMK